MTEQTTAKYAVIEYVPEFFGFAVWTESEAYRTGNVYAEHGWWGDFSPALTAEDARVWAEGLGLVIVETKTSYRYQYNPETKVTALIGWSS